MRKMYTVSYKEKEKEEEDKENKASRRGEVRRPDQMEEEEQTENIT